MNYLLQIIMSVACLSLLAGCKVEPSPRNAARPFSVQPTERGMIIYVAENGSDAGRGDEKEPLATITAALERATPGSVIRLGPGVWREKLVIRHRATADAPLVIEGSRGEDGSWLSVIDGSMAIERSQWKARPEIGPGVYSAPFAGVHSILCDGKNVARLHSEAGAPENKGSGGTGRAYTAAEVLQWPDSKTVRYQNADIPIWETIGGVFNTTEAPGEVLVRLAGEESPAKHAMAIGCEGAVVTLEGAQHVVLKGLMIQGGDFGVKLGGRETIGNAIEECRIRTGRRRILLDAGAKDTRIVGNLIEFAFIGHSTGAWATAEPNEDSSRKAFVYTFFKYWASPVSTSDDNAIRLNNGSSNTFIKGNRLVGGLIGVALHGGRDVQVIGNRIEHFSSVGTAVRKGSTNIVFDGNLFYDTGINFRMHEQHLDEPPRKVWFIRNVSMQPKGIGTHIFNHFQPRGEIADYPEHEVVFAHNTFLGGTRVMAVPHGMSRWKGLPGFSFVNNRIVDCRMVVQASEAFCNDPSKLGGFDYNQVAGTRFSRFDVPPSWLGRHCIVSPDADGWQWSVEGIIPPAEDPGRESGIDISQSYYLGNREYPPVPGFSHGYFAGKAPDLGAPAPLSFYANDDVSR